MAIHVGMSPSDVVPQEVLKDIANSFTVNNRMELLCQVEATAELCREFKTTNHAAAMQLAKELEETEALVQDIQSQLNSVDYEPVWEASREVSRLSNSLQPAVAPKVEKFAADMSRLSAQMAGDAAQPELTALQNTIASQQEEILSSLLKATAPSEDVITADERLNRGPASSNFPHNKYRDSLQTPLSSDLSQRLDPVVDYLVQYYDPTSRKDAVSYSPR